MIHTHGTVGRRSGAGGSQIAHVGHADDDLHVKLLGHARIGDLDMTCRRLVGIAAAEEPGHLRQRSLRGRQPDPLRRLAGQFAQPLQRQRQVRAPLGGRHRVDLVDDHPPHPPQRLARLRRQHQVQRLRRGDGDVGRPGDEPPTLSSAGVARPHSHRRHMHVDAQPLGGQADAGQRRPQVLVDIDGQRPQRRQVQHPGALRTSRRRLAHHPVDRPQERGKRLARPSRSSNQTMPPRRNALPPGNLALSRSSKRRREPRPSRRGKSTQRRMHPTRSCTLRRRASHPRPLLQPRCHTHRPERHRRQGSAASVAVARRSVS